MFIQKIDIRISSDILPKWNDIRTSHIQPKSEGYTNQFGYNSLGEIEKKAQLESVMDQRGLYNNDI